MLPQSTDSSDCWVFDSETNGLPPLVNKVHCIVAENLGTGQVISVNSQGGPDSLLGLLEILENAKFLIGQNIIGYDIPVLNKVLGFAPKGTIIDTVVMSRLLYPDMKGRDYAMSRTGMPPNLFGTHKLEAWGYRLGLLKGDYGKKENAWESWSREMQDYCEQDVKVTIALYTHLVAKQPSPESLKIEHDFQAIIAHQERKGILFNVQAAQRLNADIQVRRDAVLMQLQEEFPAKPARCLGPYKNQEKRYLRLAAELGDQEDSWKNDLLRAPYILNGIKFKWEKEEPFNPGSDKQVAERLMGLGWVPVDHTEHGAPKVDEDTLRSVADRFPAAKPIAEYAMLEKRLGAISSGRGAWLRKVGDDGRIHGRVNTMGTVTFRCSHSDPNMGQVPSCRLPYGNECRALFMVPESHSLVGCDVSGLELRILAHYMAAWDLGEYARLVLDGDIHTRNMEVAGLKERSQAKTMIYALIYGAGDAKLGEIIAPDLTSRDKLVRAGRELRRRFLQNTPALLKLDDAVKKKAARYKHLIGIDGRRLHCRSPHSSLNTLIQAGGSIVVKRSTNLFREILETEKRLYMGHDWSLVVHVHDEWQTECRQENADVIAATAVAAIQRAGVALKLKCPVTGESKIGRNWADTH